MVEKLRETGLEAVSHVPWGAHLCLFYETKRDLLDTQVLIASESFACGVDHS